jgi:hypothetical protein
MALEWPDLEAEEKAKEKRKKTNKLDFITSDSEDDAKPKKKKKMESSWSCTRSM